MLLICCKSKDKDRKIFIFLKLLRNILQEIYDCSIRPKVCSIICVLISQKYATIFYTSAKKGILFHFSHENIENPIKLFFNSPKSMLQKCLYKFLKSMQWICYGYKDIRGFQKIPKTETKQFNHLFLYFNFF